MHKQQDREMIKQTHHNKKITNNMCNNRINQTSYRACNNNRNAKTNMHDTQQRNNDESPHEDETHWRDEKTYKLGNSKREHKY